MHRKLICWCGTQDEGVDVWRGTVIINASRFILTLFEIIKKAK